MIVEEIRIKFKYYSHKWVIMPQFKPKMSGDEIYTDSIVLKFTWLGVKSQ